MAYKKPQIIAKSEPKQTYVAGCPTNSVNQSDVCGRYSINCMIPSMK